LTINFCSSAQTCLVRTYCASSFDFADRGDFNAKAGEDSSLMDQNYPNIAENENIPSSYDVEIKIEPMDYEALDIEISYHERRSDNVDIDNRKLVIQIDRLSPELIRKYLSKANSISTMDKRKRGRPKKSCSESVIIKTDTDAEDPPEVTCSLCLLKFHTDKALSNHSCQKYYKLPNGHWQCSICPSILVHRGGMRIHMRIHTGMSSDAQ